MPSAGSSARRHIATNTRPVNGRASSVLGNKTSICRSPRPRVNCACDVQHEVARIVKQRANFTVIGNSHIFGIVICVNACASSGQTQRADASDVNSQTAFDSRRSLSCLPGIHRGSIGTTKKSDLRNNPRKRSLRSAFFNAQQPQVLSR